MPRRPALTAARVEGIDALLTLLDRYDLDARRRGLFSLGLTSEQARAMRNAREYLRELVAYHRLAKESSDAESTDDPSAVPATR